MSATYDYSVSRTVDAPVDRVWRAWTEPEAYGTWANAEDVRLDVRPGGAWSATMKTPDGSKFPLSGSYVEVDTGKRIVMSMDGPGGDSVLMYLELAADGDGTRVTLSQSFASAEERDQSEQGSTMLLDGLATYLNP